MAETFPDATQAQLIRANQRDLMSIGTLRDRATDVLRPTMGTRWLLRWEKEVDLATRFLYLSLTTGLLNQTLGEEYVDIWQRSARTSRVPTAARRWSLVLLYCFPPYLAARQQPQRQSARDDNDSILKRVLRVLPSALEVALEVNLALFYFSGTYYSLAKRLLGVKHISSLPRDPNSRPPSYALLGVLLAIRLTHRMITTLRTISPPRANNSASSTQAREKQVQDSDEVQLDGRAVAPFLVNPAPDAIDEREEGGDVDEYSALQLRAISSSARAARRCVLCLEERSASAATECGHLFCWTCIAGWAREKPECPLCRQAVEANKIWPIANL